MTAAGNEPPVDMTRLAYPNNDQMPHIQGGFAEKRIEAGMIPQYLMDSIDFTQTPMGHIGRQSSDSAHPTLEQPLFSLRIAGTPEQGTSWQTVYDELASSLPPEQQEWMQEQARLPASDQSEAYGALKGMLEFAAKGKVWLSETSQAQIPDLAANKELVSQALLGALVHVETFLTLGREFLGTTGANQQYFDAQMGYLNQMEGLMESFSALQQAASSGALDDSLKEQIGQLTDKIGLVSTQFQNVSIGTEMQVIGPLLNIMQLSAASNLLDPGLQPLYLSLMAATSHIQTAESQIGVVGDNLALAQQGLVDWLVETLLPGLNSAEEQLVSGLATSGLLLAVVSALAAYDGTQPASGGAYE